MMKLKYLTILALFVTTPILAEETSKNINIQENAYHYLCDNKKNVTAHYINSEDQSKKETVSFLRLDIGDQSYGLTEAVSASGERYIGHHGLDLSHGLIWWSKGDSAFLSVFKGDNAQNSRIIYRNCRLLK